MEVTRHIDSRLFNGQETLVVHTDRWSSFRLNYISSSSSISSSISWLPETLVNYSRSSLNLSSPSSAAASAAEAINVNDADYCIVEDVDWRAYM